MSNDIPIGWTEKEDSRREELLKKDYTYSEVANMLSLEFGLREYTSDSVRSRSRRTNSISSQISVARINQCEEIVLTMDERVELFNAYIKRDPKKYSNTENSARHFQKTIILSDIHVPFAEYGMIDSILKTEAGKDVRCIIGGDFLDCYSLSVFRKDKEIPLRTELQEGAVLVDKLSNAFGSVEFIVGNHEDRFKKYLLDHLPTELMFLIETNLINYITDGYENTSVSDNFFIQHGSSIVGHPSIYSSIDLRSGKWAMEWYHKFMGPMNLDFFNLVIHTHTHGAGETYSDEGGRMVKIIENGCLCEIMDYASNGSRKNTPPIRGYSVVYADDDGMANLSKSRFILVD